MPQPVIITDVPALSRARVTRARPFRAKRTCVSRAAIAREFVRLEVTFHYGAKLDVLHKHEQLVVLRIINDLVEAHKVLMDELFHDGNLLFNLVQFAVDLDAVCRPLHRPLPPQQRLVEHLRRAVMPLVARLGQIDLSERPCPELLEDFVLVDRTNRAVLVHLHVLDERRLRNPFLGSRVPHARDGTRNSYMYSSIRILQ